MLYTLYMTCLDCFLQIMPPPYHAFTRQNALISPGRSVQTIVADIRNTRKHVVDPWATSTSSLDFFNVNNQPTPPTNILPLQKQSLIKGLLTMDSLNKGLSTPPRNIRGLIAGLIKGSTHGFS